MLLVGLRGFFFLVEMWDKPSFLRGRSELNYKGWKWDHIMNVD